jgi:hypothetical protein
MARLEFHRLAVRELNDVAQYYDLEKLGLGSSFLREVDRCLRAIQKNPEAGLILRGLVRRRLLRRFPYALLYTIQPTSLRIGSVGSDAAADAQFENFRRNRLTVRWRGRGRRRRRRPACYGRSRVGRGVDGLEQPN